MNRVELAALNGSKTAIVTLSAYQPVIQKSLVSDSAKPSNFQQSPNDKAKEVRQNLHNGRK